MKHMILAAACAAFIATAANAQAPQPAPSPSPSAEPKQGAPVEQQGDKQTQTPDQQQKVTKKHSK